MHRPHRRLARAAALAVTLTLFAACSGDDGGDRSGPDDADVTTTGPAAGDPDGFTYAAARLCTDVANGFDPAINEAGARANLDLVQAVVTDAPPDEATAQRIHDELRAYRDALAGARERLGALDAGDAEAAWNVVLDALDGKVARYDERIELLAAGDWEATRSGIEPGGDDGLAALEPALADLQLGGRDCEIVAWYAGNVAEHAEFLTAASSTCTTVVSRRLAEGYSTDATLSAVVTVRQGEAITATPELIAEVDALVAEWTQTLAEFAAVPTADVPDVAAWQETLDAVAERVDVHTRRADALQTGDQAAIAALFTAGQVWQHPSLGDLAALGLDARDCRSIAA